VAKNAARAEESPAESSRSNAQPAAASSEESMVIPLHRTVELAVETYSRAAGEEEL
jgi:hypothetical protein